MLTVLTTEVFDDWFAGLRDTSVKRRIQARIDRLEDGNFGDWKSIDKGVCESRLDFGAGYRLYYVRRGVEVIVLLCGGDKSSQRRDIRTAIKLAEALD